MTTTDGRTVTSEILSGGIVIPYFWASWCKHCISKSKNLKNIHKEYGSMFKGVVIHAEWPPRTRNVMCKDIKPKRVKETYKEL